MRRVNIRFHIQMKAVQPVRRCRGEALELVVLDKLLQASAIHRHNAPEIRQLGCAESTLHSKLEARNNCTNARQAAMKNLRDLCGTAYSSAAMDSLRVMLYSSQGTAHWH